MPRGWPRAHDGRARWDSRCGRAESGRSIAAKGLGPSKAGSIVQSGRQGRGGWRARRSRAEPSEKTAASERQVEAIAASASPPSPRHEVPEPQQPARQRGGALRAGRTGTAPPSGWTIDPAIPDLPKFVAIAAPHSSNWEFASVSGWSSPCASTSISSGKRSCSGGRSGRSCGGSEDCRWIEARPQGSGGADDRAVVGAHDKLIVALAPKGTGGGGDQMEERVSPDRAGRVPECRIAAGATGTTGQGGGFGFAIPPDRGRRGGHHQAARVDASMPRRDQLPGTT